MVLFTAIAIVRERERGNLELLINTPVRTPELMAGKILPYVLIGLIQATLIITLSVFLFRIPIRGNLLDLYLAALVFISANLTMGLFISTLAKTQMQAIVITSYSIHYTKLYESAFAVELWEKLLAHGATAVGLGARDSLRLEAGLPLYGHELGLDPEGNET